MKPIHVEHQVAASPAMVMATATDFPNCANYISGIEKFELLTEGPVGVGTRFKETRIMFKKESTETMEITAFDPNSGYTIEAESCGSRYITEFRYAPKDGGTLMSMDMQVLPQTFLAKIMVVVFAPMMNKMCGLILRDFEEVGVEAIAREKG